MGKKALSVVMVMVLAISLSPASAFAAELSVGGVSGASSTTASAKVSTQAGKKTMYLLSRAGDYRISYKNGLVSKVSVTRGYYSYRYSGKRMVSYHNSLMGGYHYNDGKFTYDNKGRLTHVASGGTMGAMTYQEQYSYNSKGRVSKMVHDRTGDKTTYKYTYNKKGKIAKRSTAYSMSYASPGTDAFSYDGKGNLTKIKHAYSGGSYISYKYKNTYDKGRLIKRVRTGQYSSTPMTIAYRYKRVSVPKKYVAQVKKQQWAMLNPQASVGVLPVNAVFC